MSATTEAVQLPSAAAMAVLLGATTSYTLVTEARAALIITGGGSVSTTSNAYVGTNVTNGKVYNGAGTATVGGGTGASTWTTLQNLLVGGSGTGTLTIMGGGTVSASDVLIGYAPAATAR